MASALQFTAISGAHSEEAVCYLLEVGDAKLLLDCGSFEDYSGEGLARLQRVARQVDAVLLSHPDMAHVGAYPLAYSKYGLKCPAYATQATHMMGRLCLQDVVRTLTAREDFTQFDESDVDAAFENITALQYAQPKALAGRHADIVVTAHAAGHTIGGTVWTISSGGETVLYALDFNHMKEEHLNRTSLMEGAQGKVSARLMKPTLLITGAYTALHRVPPRRRRVECFLDTVARAVRRGGNVLVPVDSAARVLELAYLLNEWWARDKARRDTHALCLLAQCSRKTRSFAQSLVGWMGGGVEAQMADRDAKPFDLRHVTAVQSIEELDRKLGGDSRARGRQRHAVVLASLEGMSGFSQDLFVRWAAGKKNVVILPQRGPPASLARHLYKRWWDRTQALTVKKRVPLEGAELEAWRAQERRRQEQEAARDALLKRKRDMLDDDDIDLETERLLSGQTYDLYVRGRGPVRGLYLVSKSYCMFPFQEKNRRSDDYGEIYDLETYMIQPDADADEGAHLLDAAAPDADKPYESDAARPESRPTKPVEKERRVQLNCELAFVDMEGRADGTSVSNIVVQLMPKRLVIVHGTSASTAALADFCRDPTVEVTKEIYTPAVGEILNVSSGVNVYRMRLADALVKHVPMTAVRGCMAGFVSGRVSFSHEDQTPTLEPDHAELSNAWCPPMLVGDPRLSALRTVLVRQGFAAHFDSEGTLVCNNAVAIKRASSKRTKSDTIKILGAPSPDFYSIRSVVYAHLAAL
ncbi:Metallo-hydrolase/oxidoreductase [Coemansia reversa NRRL 1564]|uniref:Cleavage and polyadenylation specificity factor subunit 2 n=1 Tax=Coemansia reversa (strain ATCC 12441 / NRRL 1564) TaxID=763665 RepID=A0A2G5BC41_COERN|nr:Metallo-hydrolase/oxidoreductase [Coemansia reversa NRRL 1564]|eukprot:PIA16578.1 Metallo-hydrolase/oxidoreductase [Coemansia reversa NRRL 1564]